MYELFGHTADLGIRARAASLNELFVEAAKGLMAAMLEDASTVRPQQTLTIELTGDDREYLLFDWLNQLLRAFEADRLLGGSFEVNMQPTGLSATANGEPFDPARHVLSHEVKAITYHELKVVQESDGNWLAEVIVDI